MVNITRQGAKTFVGDGWHRLIDEAYDTIENSGLLVSVVQVKEKFGTLRIYFSLPTDATQEDYKKVHSILDTVSEKSAKTCEYCGKPGELDWTFAWAKCRCPECRDLQMKRMKNINVK